jgi:uncharacterized protein YcbK (DUF882 family)
MAQKKRSRFNFSDEMDIQPKKKAIMTSHFSEKELACPCCGAYHLSEPLLERLESLREIIGKPLTLKSAYRCKKHNSQIGGSPNSQHLLGKTVDISTKNLNATEKHSLMSAASELGFNGVGVYPTFFHLDMRDDRKIWVK